MGFGIEVSSLLVFAVSRSVFRRATKGQIGEASSGGKPMKNIFGLSDPSSWILRTDAFVPRKIEAG
jgi:hypothetical protein